MRTLTKPSGRSAQKNWLIYQAGFWLRRRSWLTTGKGALPAYCLTLGHRNSSNNRFKGMHAKQCWQAGQQQTQNNNDCK